MPIFEYECRICSEAFDELIRRAEDEVDVRCPNCKSQEIEKKLSVFGFSSGSRTMTSSDGSGCGSCSHGHCATCR